eukprot:Skav200751  [mRNA]  locus=scaffold1117:290829:294834:- [translate_table: standard]
MSQISSEEVAMSRMQRKMNKIAAKRQRELLEAREQIASFLKANDFPKGDTNGKKGIFFVTFPLHEAVKQNNPYMTANLLLFGAIPAMKDTWGRTADDYAGKKTHQQIRKVFQESGHSPSAPSRQLHLSQLQRHPPPRGFEEFFAKLAEDPLVQVPNCEAQWLKELGPRSLRKAAADRSQKV